MVALVYLEQNTPRYTYTVIEMSIETPLLDSEVIASAADYINSTLISKGYITEQLKFNTIDWHELIKDQNINAEEDSLSTNLKVTDAMFNNDKNLINIIYSLLQSIERNKVQNKTFNQVVSQKDVTITKLQKQISDLEIQLHGAESKYDRESVVRRMQLTKRLQEISRINKLQVQDLSKLKNWCSDVKIKYRIEMKRKNSEIEQLKHQLLEKKSLSTTTAYGLPIRSDSSPTTRSVDQNINPNIIYNNNAIMDNTNSKFQMQTEGENFVNTEYENIVVDLTHLVDNLISENYKFSKFMMSINTYYQTLNYLLSNFNRFFEVDKLPNPSDTIDLKKYTDLNFKDNMDEVVNEIGPFEYIAKPLLNNVYRNYHSIADMILLYNSQNSQTNGSQSASSNKIEDLKAELETVRNNWQGALRTLENWRNYQQSSLSKG